MRTRIIIVEDEGLIALDLKKRLEHAAEAVGLLTLSSAQGAGIPTVATRIAIEELEAWFIGDFDALAVFDRFVDACRRGLGA